MKLRLGNNYRRGERPNYVVSLLMHACLAVVLLLCLPNPGFAAYTIERVPGLAGGAINTHVITGDGLKVVFTSGDDPAGQNPDRNFEVFVYDLATKRTVQITNTTDQQGFWSNRGVLANHDGTRIIFLSRFALNAGNAHLPGLDLFLAQVNYSTDPATVSFRRLTATDERGPYAFSGDGTKIALVSNHNLAGRNAERLYEVFRMNVDPATSIAQLTDTPAGIVDMNNLWRSAVDLNYDGSKIAFLSNRDLVAGGNPDLNLEIFSVTTSGYVQQYTATAAGVNIRNMRMGSGGQIVFTSNGDLTGGNADGNTELFFRWIPTDQPVQITSTTGGDDGFGGANDDLDINYDANKIVFRSNRDLVAGGNADGNRELFVASRDNQNVVRFEQVTNTTTAQPGTRFENDYGKIDSAGVKIAFNSDLDLGVSGTSPLFVAASSAGPDTSPPSVDAIFPWAGGPGVPVSIYGRHLGSATAVRFGALDAIRFDRITNEMIKAIVPQNIAEAPIVVVTPYGTAQSSSNFKPANLVTFGQEFNQGIASYPGIAGKDALVRVFTGVNEQFGAWMVSSASLSVSTPSGSIFTVQPNMYAPIVEGMQQSHSERANVNFPVPGTLLSESGNYAFRMQIQTLGNSVYDQTINHSLTKTRDVTLYFRSVLRQPDESEWREIFRGLEELSRIYPVRAGVGDLQGALGADEFETGLRVAYLTAPIWENDPRLVNDGAALLSPECYGEIFDAVNDGLAAINSGGFELTEFGVAFIPRDKIPGQKGPVGCPIINCETFEQTGNFRDADGNTMNILGAAGGTSEFVLLCDGADGVFSHETGHLFGLDHSEADFVYISEPAFNLRSWQNITYPKNVMIFYGPLEDLFLGQERDGVQNDYVRVVDSRAVQAPALMSSSGASVTSLRKPRWTVHTKKGSDRFTLMATVNRSGDLQVRDSFIAQGPGPVTVLDETSPFAMVFFDGAGRVLSRDPIAPAASGSADLPAGHKRADGGFSLTAIRPLPPKTAAIEIQRNSVPVHRIHPGKQLPRIDGITVTGVTVQRKKGLRVSWKASDPDRDALYYHLEYSRDGGKTFVPLAVSTARNQLDFDAEDLPGGDRLRIRITASDGLNTARSISSRFSLPEHAPHVGITSLRNNDRYDQNATIMLRGLAYDMEDGLIAGKQQGKRFVWIADGKQQLGSGPILAIKQKLKPGPHTITLKVKDTSGRESKDSVTIFVQDKKGWKPGTSLKR